MPPRLSTHALPCLASAIALVIARPGAASDKPENGTGPGSSLILSEQYGGLVINQTVSVAGQDFYRHFSTAWRDSGLSERFTLTVHEVPSARWGSRVRVEYAGRVIFQAALPVARPAIPGIGQQAADVVRQRIMDAEVDRLLFREADLGADEI